jgi:hypothetical protein
MDALTLCIVGERGFAVNKDTTVCFRTSQDTRQALDDLARNEKLSISAVIHGLLLEYVREKQVRPAEGSEKRQHLRKKVSLPAFVYESDPKSARPGTILDLSLAGARISVPQSDRLELDETTKEKQLGLLFTLPLEKKAITVKCCTTRVQGTDGSAEVGARFVDSDFESYQRLQNFLLQ